MCRSSRGPVLLMWIQMLKSQLKLILMVLLSCDYTCLSISQYWDGFHHVNADWKIGFALNPFCPLNAPLMYSAAVCPTPYSLIFNEITMLIRKARLLKKSHFLAQFEYLAHTEVCDQHLEELGFRKRELFDCLQRKYIVSFESLSDMFSSFVTLKSWIRETLEEQCDLA